LNQPFGTFRQEEKPDKGWETRTRKSGGGKYAEGRGGETGWGGKGGDWRGQGLAAVPKQSRTLTRIENAVEKDSF